MARKKTPAVTVGRSVGAILKLLESAKVSVLDLFTRHPIGAILKRLKSAKVSVLDLFAVYHTRDYEALWKRDPRLHHAFVKKLIGAGHPIRAYDLVREGLRIHEDDAHLKYLGALALARGGNVDQAGFYNQKVLATPELDAGIEAEARSLAGRLYKMQFMRTRDATRRVELAQQSRDCYREAYEKSGQYFPLINWATMSLLGDDPVTAYEKAAKVLEGLGPGTGRAAKQRDYWHFATLGEAHLILGDLPSAVAAYTQAVSYAGDNVGDIGAMRLNARLLAQRKGLKREEISLNLGCVVAFSGHMIDHPTQWRGRPPRFPADPTLERMVGEAIGREIDRLNATIGYCSAACGSDILFAEQMLARGAELHVVLPFDNSDFYRTSVDYNEDTMRAWQRRCDNVLVKAKEIHYATRELYRDDDVLFEFGTVITQGLAIIRADERGVDPYALVVLDTESSGRRGGTSSFAEKWPKWCHEPVSIDLRALREGAGKSMVELSDGDSRPAHADESTRPDGRLEREVKAMLFADVKGFSKLPDHRIPDFFYTFLNVVEQAIAASNPGPVCQNTWGDGLYLVFDRVTDAASFALQLLDRVKQVPWEELGLPRSTTVRIGMHAGPVFRRLDPILGKENVFGSQVNRAARIEPVTTPSCVFVSEHFAAMLAVEAGHATEPDRQFACEYVGMEDLAKDYDRCALYRLTRRL
jgi:class 3 adenylate cyclase/tetratricopeptide (TPR) repeat protein